jgi:hypothetical protein
MNFEIHSTLLVESKRKGCESNTCKLRMQDQRDVRLPMLPQMLSRAKTSQKDGFKNLVKPLKSLVHPAGFEPTAPRLGNGTLSAWEDQRRRSGFEVRRQPSSDPKSRRSARPQVRVPCGVQTQTPHPGGASENDAESVYGLLPRSIG